MLKKFVSSVTLTRSLPIKCHKPNPQIDVADLLTGLLFGLWSPWAFSLLQVPPCLQFMYLPNNFKHKINDHSCSLLFTFYFPVWL